MARELDVVLCFRKRHFKTDDAAKTFATKVKERFGSDQYTYYCGTCLGFHLTSQKPKEQPQPPAPPPKPKTYTKKAKTFEDRVIAPWPGEKVFDMTGKKSTTFKVLGYIGRHGNQPGAYWACHCKVCNVNFSLRGTDLRRILDVGEDTGCYVKAHRCKSKTRRQQFLQQLKENA